MFLVIVGIKWENDLILENSNFKNFEMNDLLVIKCFFCELVFKVCFSFGLFKWVKFDFDEMENSKICWIILFIIKEIVCWK